MAAPLELDCLGVDAKGMIGRRHTGRGEDVSPGFRLKNLSPRGKTLAVTLEDLSHPVKNFTHWLVWNLPAGEEIAEGIPAGRRAPTRGAARPGIGYRLYRYAGPKPPGKAVHQYRFTVYVLDGPLSLGWPETKGRLLRAAEGHILQQGSVVGSFGWKP